MASSEIDLFNDMERNLTAGLRIITHEKGRCFKIEKA